MALKQSIIELGSWLKSPPGRVLLDWEQRRLDDAVGDRFGFHAVQLGLPSVQSLRANRMPYRWIASDVVVDAETAPGAPPALRCDFEALPFPNHSIDLVVLPHTLELAHDPHLTLREVERVLVPEGRIVITGLNPASLWGLRQRAGRLWRGAGFARARPPYLPRAGEFIGYWRLRDWLRLLGFELEASHFGCYRPPLRSELWLQRWNWIEGVGDRWWPVLGAAYQLEAVKRVRGMRLVGLVKRERVKRAKAATAVNREHEPARRHAKALERET